MALIDTSNLPLQESSLHLLPPEGPKIIPLILDISVVTSWLLDLTQLYNQTFITMIQTLYIDASDPAIAGLISVVTGVSQPQTIQVKPGTQGYYNVMVPNPPKLTFNAANPGGTLRVGVINVAIPGHSWQAV